MKRANIGGSVTDISYFGLKQAPTMAAFDCDECSQVFKSLQGFAIHKCYVHNGIRYGCKDCETLFRSQSNLIVHQKLKNEGLGLSRKIKQASSAAFVCDECSKVLTSPHGLALHKRNVHDGIRHSCEDCKNSFTSQSNLMVHRQ